MAQGHWWRGAGAVVGGALVAAPAWGQRTIHVALCGNDAWTGLSDVCQAPDGPKRTVAAGVAAALSGDTVLVADGTYVVDFIDAVDRSITLRSVGGAAACVLVGPGPVDRPMLRLGGAPSSPVVEGFTFRGARMTSSTWPGGAAINFIGGPSPVIRRCVFADNQATYLGGSSEGGAVVVYGGGTPLIADCLFVNNQAGSGGALLVAGGAGMNATVVNCVFANNSAASGAAIHVRFASCAVRNCTIVANTASFGALAFPPNAFGTIGNSILWGNAGGAIWDGRNGVTASYSDIQGGFPGAGNLNVDPRLVAGEPLGNRVLAPGSRCIDAGSNGMVPAGVTTDLTGLVRFRDDAGMPDTGAGAPPIVDMGANEFQGTTCYANCDESTMLPVLNVGDFVCFQSRFAAQDPWANCDGSTTPPVLGAADFVCFQERFAAGCP